MKIYEYRVNIDATNIESMNLHMHNIIFLWILSVRGICQTKAERRGFPSYLFCNYSRFLLSLKSLLIFWQLLLSSTTAPVTTIIYQNGVGAHFELFLVATLLFLLQFHNKSDA